MRVPHVGAEMPLSEIVVHTTESNVQRSCNRSLRISAVRTGMPRRVAPQDKERVACIIAQEEGRHHKEDARDARGNIVQHIVHTRRHAPEVEIAVILVAEHGVHCIRCPIEHGERCAAEEKEEKRRDDSVHCILRDGLNRRARSVLLVELRRIPPDDIADAHPCTHKVIPVEQGIDFMPRLCQ